ncbi:hypothetical protein PCASD_05379 [Puccinia coronata f. sp. avenae]|uniref:RING-type domain-containing protein n=1 Tax=Puccinia coronata f. sp. avenae TaxID=200324 RepID=A0A2N5UV82_9BASI|nr:hypothetical protein PCASD_05379 [Puccinia coronata f. sp. avenae]
MPWVLQKLVQVARLITAIPVEGVTGPLSKSLIERLREKFNPLKVQLRGFWTAPNSRPGRLNNRAQNDAAQYLTSPSEPSHQHSIDSESGMPAPGIGNTCSRPIQNVEHNHAKDEQEEICIICLEKFEESQDIEPFKPCQHQFHKYCLQPWTAEHWTCPICVKEDQNLDSFLLVRLSDLKSRFLWHHIGLSNLVKEVASPPEAEHHLRLTELYQSDLPPEDQLICLEKLVWHHEDWIDFWIQVAFYPKAELADSKELAWRHQHLLSRWELLDLRPEAGFASMKQLASRHQDFLSHLERPARIRRLAQLSDAHKMWLEQLETYYLRVRDLSSTAGRAVWNGELENPGIDTTDLHELHESI